MFNSNDIYYIRDFANTCEEIQAFEVSDVAPKIIDVLPYVLECSFGLSCKSQKDKALSFLDDGAFESALIAVIPPGMIVASSMDYPWTFTFSNLDRFQFQRTYTTTAKIYSLGMLCSFLRFICDNKENLAEAKISKQKSRLMRIVSSTAGFRNRGK